MKKNSNLSKEMLESILTKEELDTLKEAYTMHKGVKDKEVADYLLRRMDDVISMVTFISLTYPEFRSEDYDALAMRMANLRTTMHSINTPTEEPRAFNFLMNGQKTPYILNSLSFTDITRYHEIDSLLDGIVSGLPEEVTLYGDLKASVGEVYHIIYLRDANGVHIYDFDSNLSPRIKKAEYPRYEILLKESAKKKTNPTIQRINDEIVYQTVKIDFNNLGHGYSLVKKNEKER